MVITREMRDETKNSVSSSIGSILKDEEFISPGTKSSWREETGLLKYENECLSQKLDDIEQANRCNNVRIFNVKENPQENTVEEVIHILHSHLGITVKNNNILLCTRIGKQVNNRTRGILLKLSNFSMKQEIYKKKFITISMSFSKTLINQTSNLKVIAPSRPYSWSKVFPDQGCVIVKEHHHPFLHTTGQKSY
nr:unnamed protein product [Callosobruchus chinensis]